MLHVVHQQVGGRTFFSKILVKRVRSLVEGCFNATFIGNFAATDGADLNIWPWFSAEADPEITIWRKIETPARGVLFDVLGHHLLKTPAFRGRTRRSTQSCDGFSCLFVFIHTHSEYWI